MIKRISSGLAALLLSISSVLLIAPAPASAAVDACTFTNGGGTLNFNNAGNWSCSIDGSAVPTNGDSLIFNNSSLTADQTINNDIPSLTVDNITLSGTNETYDYTIEGNAISLSGGITSTTQANTTILNNVTLTGDQSFNGAFSLGGFNTPTTLDIGSHTLTVSVAASENCSFQHIYSVISGAGAITKTDGGAVNLYGVNTYDGTTSVNEGWLGLGRGATLGSTAGHSVVAPGASLGIELSADTTVSEAITVGGTGLTTLNGAIVDYVSGCGGGGARETLPTMQLAGAVTLTSDTVFATIKSNIKITGALSGNYTASMAAGSVGSLIIDSSSNTSKTPNGTTRPKATVTEYKDDAPGTPIYAGPNQIAVVTGRYGNVTVDNGGTLKGTGTVGLLDVQSAGTLAPGLSPGCLNSGNLKLAGKYEVEMAGAAPCEQYDQTIVTGTVDVTGGTLNVSFLNNYLPVAGDIFTIISNDGNDAVTGTFEGLEEGATYTSGEVAFRISYAGGDSNDVTLTVISSPNTGFALLSANPAVTLALTTLAAGAILLIGRRFSKVFGR